VDALAGVRAGIAHDCANWAGSGAAGYGAFAVSAGTGSGCVLGAGVLRSGFEEAMLHLVECHQSWLKSFFGLTGLGKPMPSTGKTVTRLELYDAVYREVGLSRSESSDLVELVLKEISDTIARGEAVKLSSFGTFTVRQKRQRMGRNPKTGVEVPISPRRVVVFKASAVMKQRINDGRPNPKKASTEESVRPGNSFG
jgi:integration host factor subunit alpha